jgi:predicted flap endonuclease-1-like 5' DNA nuclease
VPPPPPPAPRREEIQQALATAQTELRQARLELERQREQIKGRDSHITQLREKLQARDATVAELEAELTELRNRPVPTATAASDAAAGDDLKRIRGIGAGYERALQQAGVTTFADIAAWTDDDIARFADLLHTHKSRIERSQWVQQARDLTLPPA